MHTIHVIDQQSVEFDNVIPLRTSLSLKIHMIFNDLLMLILLGGLICEHFLKHSLLLYMVMVLDQLESLWTCSHGGNIEYSLNIDIDL